MAMGREEAHVEVDCVGLKKITVVASIDKHKAYISKELCGVNDTQRQSLVLSCCKTKTLRTQT